MSAFTSELTIENARKNIDSRLIALRDGCREDGVPTILVDGLNELILFASVKNPKRILELGTAAGCSGIAMLQACPCAELVTIERDENMFRKAEENFSEFGVDGRVSRYLGDADEILGKLEGKFDFVFLDCNKSKYRVFLPLIKNLMNDGGVLFADNVLFRGYVSGEAETPKKYRSIVKNMTAFLEMITSDADFITTVLDVGDGISISYKKGANEKG